MQKKTKKKNNLGLLECAESFQKLTNVDVRLELKAAVVQLQHFGSK